MTWNKYKEFLPRRSLPTRSWATGTGCRSSGCIPYEEYDKHCIIYTWKILEGVVPSPSTQGETIKSQSHGHPRPNGTCSRKLTSVLHRLKAVEGSLFNCLLFNLFNCLPKAVRDTTKYSIEAFSGRLDSLRTFPMNLSFHAAKCRIQQWCGSDAL